MPEWLKIIFLGIVEGITEFLPISSTGHLLIVQEWMTRQSDLFNVVIQCGALMAVILIYQARLKRLAFGWKEPENRDYLMKLLAAFFLTGVGGVIIKAMGFELPEEPMPVILALLIGGVGLIWIERHVVGRSLSDAISWRAALIMGAGQLLAAVFPGTSRSGATILLALLVGLSRKAAVEFTFLLGIPTLLAAGGLEIALAIKDGEWQGEHMGHLILGTLVSAVTAFIAVRWLLRYVQTHNFIAFGWYRIILAVILLLVFMT